MRHSMRCAPVLARFARFDREAALIKDDLLEPIDRLLDDVDLIELVREAQAKRAPAARTMGRKTIAPDRLLRCCALKHIKNWSFRELERELRGSLVYRHFTRFDEQRIPDFCTFSRNFAVLGPDVTRQIHDRIVRLARQADVAPGKKLRTDTTVVETNVHYPTDSTLLQDGIRVLTRAVKRIAAECAGDAAIVDHRRAAQRRVLEIHRAARSFTEASRERFEESYGSWSVSPAPSFDAPRRCPQISRAASSRSSAAPSASSLLKVPFGISHPSCRR